MRLGPWLLASTVALGLSYALLSACSGSTQTHAYIPGPLMRRQNPLIQLPATKLPECAARTYNAPGTFIVLSTLGNFTGSSFSDSGFSLWASVSLKKGRDEIPIIRLPHIRSSYTVYYGTYKLDNGLVGCFYLAKAKYEGISFDGAAVATPWVYDFGKRTFVAEGPLAVAIHSIGRKSGSGTLSLKSASTGKVVHTGTVAIKNSVFVP